MGPTSQTTSQTTIKPTANIKITTTRKMATKLSTLFPPTSQTTSQTTIKPTANIKITTTRKMATKLSKIVPLTLDGAEYGATSVHGNDNEKFGPKRAFQRAHFKSKNDRSFPWISAAGAAFPQTVHVTLPFATTVTSFSFRSRHEPFQ